MKFMINKNDFKIRDEQDGTLSLMILSTSQLIYLNTTARLLIQQEGTVDFEDFLKQLKFDGVEEVELRSDYQDLIYQLEALGIIEIIEQEQLSENGCMLVGEKEYREVSKFILENGNNKFNLIDMTYPDNYSLPNLRARQFNGEEFNIIKLKDGKIIADVILAVAPFNTGISVVSFSAIVMDKSIEEDNVGNIIKELLEYSSGLFVDKYNKIRFYYTDEKQDYILNILKNIGFKKTCTLKKEICKNIDLTLYDKMI